MRRKKPRNNSTNNRFITVSIVAVTSTGCVTPQQEEAYYKQSCEQFISAPGAPAYCADWLDREKAALKEKQRIEDILNAQAQEHQKAEQAASEEDIRLGYRLITFEDFALDGAALLGSKISIKGIYVEQGIRLMRDRMTALRWIQSGEENNSVSIPLVADAAPRDSRKIFLGCDSTYHLYGCEMIIRGRVERVMLQNGYGASWSATGIIVDSARY